MLTAAAACRAPSPAQVFWQGIFLAVNVYNLVPLLYERYATVSMSREELDVFERIFLPHGVTPAQFERLLGCAQWKTVGCGHVLAIEGAAASDERTSVQLTLVHSGRLAFKSGSEVISTRLSHVWPASRAAVVPSAHTPATDFLGDFVGDLSFFECLQQEGQPEGATDACFVAREADEAGRLVTIETTGRLNRLLVWDAARLRQTLLDDLDLRVRMVQVLAANIASKLEASHDQALQPVPSSR